MYRGISLKPPQGRIAAELRFKRHYVPFKVQCTCGVVQSSKAAFNALKLRFKNCKAAVQCPTGFQCSGAAVLSPASYESSIAERKAPVAQFKWFNEPAALFKRFKATESRFKGF